jgi:hypothetical protein
MEVQTFGAGVVPDPATRPPAPVRLRPAPGLIAATQTALRTGSDARREAIVLWAGRADGASGAVLSHLILPRFSSRRDFLTIPQDERATVAAYLRAEGLLAFADLHTHPRRAFLSDADITAPFSIRDGFYAVVVPDFASRAPGAGWRFYEVRRRSWAEIDPKERIDGWTL